MKFSFYKMNFSFYKMNFSFVKKQRNISINISNKKFCKKLFAKKHTLRLQFYVEYVGNGFKFI